MKKKKFWVIPLIIGVMLIIAGVVLIATAPEEIAMGQPGWFDSSSARDGHIVGGIFAIMVGVIAIILSITLNYMFNSKEAQEADKFREKLTGAIFNFETDESKEDKTCAYCGAKLGNDGVCHNCGAKQSK